ncbi:MAG: hypothetical protein AAF968_11620, partial [Pseudomonadota bacterium]
LNARQRRVRVAGCFEACKPLVAGGVSSLPAAIAVFALARLPVFALYLGFALVGSMAAGLLFGAWV